MLFIQVTVVLSLAFLMLAMAMEAGQWIGARIADRHVETD